MKTRSNAGSLQLSLRLDDDGSAELVAVANANGFAGHGSAWFRQTELRDFALGISSYPLEESVSIAGGYYSEAKPEELEQLHLEIRVYPISGRGQLGVRVVLGDRYQLGDRKEAVHSVALELRTVYSRMEQFSLDLRSLLAGKCDEAVLREEVL